MLNGCVIFAYLTWAQVQSGNCQLASFIYSSMTHFCIKSHPDGPFFILDPNVPSCEQKGKTSEVPTARDKLVSTYFTRQIHKRLNHFLRLLSVNVKSTAKPCAGVTTPVEMLCHARNTLELLIGGLYICCLQLQVLKQNTDQVEESPDTSTHSSAHEL